MADITYVRLDEAFVYLAVILDAFSRKVVGWALADHLKASLALEALADGAGWRDVLSPADWSTTPIGACNMPAATTRPLEAQASSRA